MSTPIPKRSGSSTSTGTYAPTTAALRCPSTTWPGCASRCPPRKTSGSVTHTFLDAAGRTHTYELAGRRVRISYDGGRRRFACRQITRRSPNGHQTQILTTRTDADPAVIAYAMFSRWRQENFFRHLRHRYDLDGLDAYTTVPDDPDRVVPNPAKRAATRHAAELADGIDDAQAFHYRHTAAGVPAHARGGVAVVEGLGVVDAVGELGGVSGRGAFGGVGHDAVGVVGHGGVGVEAVEVVAVTQVAEEVLLTPAGEHRVGDHGRVGVGAGGQDLGLVAVGRAAGDLAAGEAAPPAVVADAHPPVGQLIGVGPPGRVEERVGRERAGRLGGLHALAVGEYVKAGLVELGEQLR